MRWSCAGSALRCWAELSAALPCWALPCKMARRLDCAAAAKDGADCSAGPGVNDDDDSYADADADAALCRCVTAMPMVMPATMSCCGRATFLCS